MEVLKRHSVLYAEDESIIRLNIGRQLKTYFDEVFIAKDGAEAMLLYNTKNPDILFLDIDMPEVSGIDVAKKVRESDPNIPIVILTAYTETHYLLAAIDLNITKYLVKPLQKQDLQEALQKMETELTKTASTLLKLKSDICWHIENKVLYNKEGEIALSEKERILLHILLQSPNDCVTHETIMAQVWEDAFDQEITFDSVKNLVKNLRKKLEGNTIRSIYGKGYILN